MTFLIPVLINPADKHPPKRSKKSMAKKKSWVAAARKAGAVTRGGKVMTKASALKRGIRVPGFITPTEARRGKSTARTTARRKGAWQKLTGGGKKPAVSKKTKSWRARKGYTRGRSYKKGTKYESKAEPIKWTEAAAASGAVYPAGHKKRIKGKLKDVSGRVMTKDDALRYQRPVVGFLTRGMISGFYDRVLEGNRVTKSKKKLAEAQAWIREKSKRLAQARRKRASPWKRSPQYYTKSGVTPQGKKYKKGQRKPDYKQSWSSKKAKFQRGGGKHLRVKHRKGRGPVARTSLFRGFSPSQAEIFELESGGFGGPLSEPGGVVQHNRRRRRKTRRNARRRSAARTTKKNPRRRRKVSANKRRRRKKKTTRRRKRRNSSKLKVYNNPRRRRRKKKTRRRRRKVSANKRRRSYGYRRRRKVSANPRRRRGRRRVKRNARRRVRKNFLGMQLAQAQSMSFWKGVAGILGGMGGTALLSNWAMQQQWISGWAYEPGLMGHVKRTAVRSASAALISAGAYAGRSVLGARAWQTTLAGGAAYTLGMVLLEATPLGRMLGLGMGMPMSYSAMPANGQAGMGSVLSPRQLVEGESASRLSSEFSGMNDWMELSGLGTGYPVPIEDLRGYPGQYGGGMSDWVEFKPDTGFVQRHEFAPSEEHF